MQMIFSGAGNRRLPGDRVERVVGRMPCGLLGQFRQRAGGDGFAQRRILLAEARREIDDAVVGHGAVSVTPPME